MQQTNPNPPTPATPIEVITPADPLPQANRTPAPTPTAAANVFGLGTTRSHPTVAFLSLYHIVINLQLHRIRTPKLTQLAQTSPSPPRPRTLSSVHEMPRKMGEKRIIARDCRARSFVVATEVMKDSVIPLTAMMGM